MLSRLDVRAGEHLGCQAAWRSIQAYTSRSLHRRCLPILYAGNPHSRHLSRTVRSGTASIAATSRADSMRLEPPRVPARGLECCLRAVTSLFPLLLDGVFVRILHLLSIEAMGSAPAAHSHGFVALPRFPLPRRLVGRGLPGRTGRRDHGG